MKLDKYIEPKINRKIIKFFLENPSSVDTARGIATWINEDADDTESALKELSRAKILIPHGNGVTAAYSYTTNASIVAKIKIGIGRVKPPE